MALTLILGPMKSGKSLELIARMAPYEFANKKIQYVQPIKNVRESAITSRSGLKAKASKMSSLTQVNPKTDVIGVDETFMFDVSDVQIIKSWLDNDKEVIISSLDLDYSGTLIETVKLLLEFKPEQIIYKKAVCDNCKSYDAVYTQILHKGKAVTGGLPSVVPEDGTYVYEPRCRTCFVSARW